MSINKKFKFKKNEAHDFKVKDRKFKYQHIKIETQYKNNKKGPLIIETPFLFSFGVSEKKITRNR